ncbi:transposase [Bradyrhizobium sp. RT5a]|uniref:transposase n=1 Tax=unclassified Bradyrhizobium TaxID=2631580 RepID=UPI003393AA36
MTDNTILPFSFPAVHAKKVIAAFDGGRLTSNGGVMLLAMAERRLGLADNLARVFPDRRDPTRADDIRTRRAIENLHVLRGYTETRHKAKSWDRERRTVARIEATMLGLDIRFVVTSLDVGSAEWIYASLYCARGQAENLIKLHKTQLASDRTSCRSALANQVRLVLHTAAYWLMLTVRDAIPKVRELATAEFATLRLLLLKIAARVVETTSRIRLAFAAACPEADLIRCLPGALLPLGP